MKNDRGQGELRTFADCVFLKKYSHELQGSSVLISHVTFNNSRMTQRGSTPVAYPVHAVFLRYIKKYKMWLIRNEHSSLAFKELIIESRGGLMNADIGRP